MKPKSLPIAITSGVVMLLGTVAMAIGIGLPQWSKTKNNFLRDVETGLFERCVDGGSCEDRDDDTDELRLVIALCIIACALGLVAVVVTLAFFIMFYRRTLNPCFVHLPWATLFWSLVSGSVMMAALILFEDKEYDPDDEYNNLGMSFVFAAIGGGAVAIGGLIFFIISHWLVKFVRQEELIELQRYKRYANSVKSLKSTKSSKSRTSSKMF